MSEFGSTATRTLGSSPSARLDDEVGEREVEIVITKSMAKAISGRSRLSGNVYEI